MYMLENNDFHIPVNNTDKCLGCKFWLYFKNENRERCSVKGCWNNSKYVPYVVKEDNGKRREFINEK